MKPDMAFMGLGKSNSVGHLVQFCEPHSEKHDADLPAEGRHHKHWTKMKRNLNPRP